MPSVRPDASTDAPLVPWRVSPEPFPLREETVAALRVLGRDLLAFYQAANRLYAGASRGQLPHWVLGYLDRGKPERVRELGQLRRMRSHLPRIIRPDLMARDDGTLCATELDSVPGGFGTLAALTRRYAELGFDPVGGPEGIPRALADMFNEVAERDAPTVAIVVADESEDYRAEMITIASDLQAAGLDAHAVHPRDLSLHGNALCFGDDARRVDVVYRFLELHDLPNIPKLDLIVYAMKHRLAVVTPPFKAYLEEKLLLALFQHPDLEEFWRRELGKDVMTRLRTALAPTWVLDPAPLPPFAAIDPALVTAGRRVRTWDELPGLSQRQRRLVIKPSGFSELAWGARGVTVGHDVSADAWGQAVQQALESFPTCPYVIQPYYESRRVPVPFFDFEADEVRQMDGRARISPFYIVANDDVTLAGVLVTVVPSANKVIHGTPESVLAPAVVSDDAVI